MSARDHKAAYARRQARARALGFTGYPQLRALGGARAAQLTTRAGWTALPADAQRTRDTALRVLADMRTTGDTLATAAARHPDAHPEDVRFWVSEALTGRTGRAKARRADRLYRPMRALTTQGPVTLDLRGSRAAATIGAYWNAVNHYLATGDTGPLDTFTGVRVGGVTLATDPDLIEHVAHIGELSFESIYAAVA
jgi:hypothetical protein